MPEHTCASCVKLAYRKGQPYCQALRELQPSSCWVYSDDPEFWERYQAAVTAYAQLREPAKAAG